jgi:hypothetical protein
MDTHLFFAQKTSFQVLSKWVPIKKNCSRTILFKFFTNWYICLFFQGSMRLQVVDPSHEQIKSIQSSIKSTPSLKLHQEFFSPNKSIASQPN